MRSLLDDLRQAVRVLVKRPRFVAAIAVPLALGIGANTAIFGMVDAVLFRPLPVQEPDSLARVYAVYPDIPDGLNGSAYPIYVEYRDSTSAFAGLAAFSDAGPVNLATGNGAAERVQCSAVTGNFFDVLGVRAARGRTIERSDDGAPGASPVVVLSDRIWRHRFGADPAVVGTSLRLNGREFTIVGVAPAGFSGLDLDAIDAIPDVWAPTSMADSLFPEFAPLKPLTRRGFGWLQVVGRLAPGVSVAQAQAALDTFAAARDAEANDPKHHDPSPRVVPAVQASLDPSSGGSTQRLAWLLFGIVACVLLIACADAAGLLVVRAEERQREVAIRQAIGASRWRIVRQLLLESVLVSGLGAVAGLAFANWLSDLLVALSPAGFALPPEVASPVGSPRVLAFTALIAVLTAILFGTVPALRGSKVELTPSLKDEVRVVTVGRGRFGLRYAFVVLQVALSAVLLVGAGLLLRTLWNAYRVDPGFESSGLLVASVDVAKQGFDEAGGRAVYERLVEQARAIPGVQSAALARSVPIQRVGMRSSVELGDVELPEDEHADLNVVGPDFFATMRIPVLRGRAFEASDLEGSQPVMVVNQAFADRYWPGQDAVGKRIKNIGPEGGAGSEIVGVVANFKAHSVREEPAPVMFAPAAQFYLPRMSVVVRTEGDPSTLVGPLRAAAAQIDPDMPVFNVRTGDEQLGLVLAQERVVAGLLVTFAVIAILLAATGFYALFAYLTRLRAREFAIRVALGAGRRNLVGLVVAPGAAFAALGAALGLVAAGALSGVLSDLLFDVAPLDPASFAAAGLLIVAVAALACYFPARRASRVDPATALRYE